MDDELQSALTEAQESFGDDRFQLCRLTAEKDGETVRLSGTVLDDETVVATLASLRHRLPETRFDATQVKVLAAQPVPQLAVHTNLTDLRRRPSWLAEQLNQVLNGTVVEQLDSEDNWVLARLEDGYLGWLYAPFLGPVAQRPEPTHLIAAPVALLRRTPDEREPIAGRYFAGTLVAVSGNVVREGWAEVSLTGNVVGYVAESDVRTLDPLPDPAARRGQLVADAMQYIGVPYLWGGTTIQGIDCSGFAQLLHKLAGVTIPRDADQQFTAGQVVGPPFEAGDLLYFGGSGGHRAISHVGISLGSGAHPQGWVIIHSGRPRNGVYIDNVQAVEWMRERFQGARRFLA